VLELDFGLGLRLLSLSIFIYIYIYSFIQTKLTIAVMAQIESKERVTVQSLVRFIAFLRDVFSAQYRRPSSD